MTKYNIVLEDNEEFILVQTDSLEKAQKRLQEMEENDLYLSEYYNWDRLPKYKIVKEIINNE